MSISIIEEIRKRTMRYYYEDGLVEIAVGLQFFVIGAVLWVIEDWLEGGAYALVMSFGLFLLIWTGARGVKFLVTNMKERITYPRTGAVEYSGQPDPRRWRIVIAMAVLVMINFFLPAGLIKIPMMMSTILAVILLFLGSRVGLKRMQITAILPLLAGAMSMSVNWSEVRGAGFVFIVAGLPLALIGLIVLRNYLQNNPVENGEV